MATGTQTDIARHLHDFEQKLGKRIEDLFANKFLQANDPTSSALLTALADLKTEFTERIDEADTRHRREIAALTDEVKALRDQQVQFMQSGQYFSMVPASPFIHRLYHEHYYEKCHVGYFAAQRFFADLKWGSHCFVQSSTIAHCLMMSVDANPNIDGSCLIYTNSAVAPIPLLFGSTISRHSIWPFRGHLFDNACGGWLLPASDEPAFNALRELFQRKTDPLETAFITPRYIVPNDAVYFEREEAASLANVLATEAKQVVLLAVGDRVKASRNELPAGVTVYPALHRVMTNAREKITAVIGWPQHGPQPVAQKLKASVGTLHWQCTEGWQEV